MAPCGSRLSEALRPFASILPTLAILLLGPGILASCGGGEPPAATPAASAAASAAPAAAPSSGSPGRATARAPVTLTGDRPYESSELGALHGIVLFEGKAPERFPLGAVDSAECRHHPGVDQHSNAVLVNDGKLANVYVALDSGFDPERIPPVPAQGVTLEQKGCMYVPRVLALRAGQLLRVTNQDPTTHNVHTRSKRNPEMNRNMGAKQEPIEFRFEKPERPVPFKCDIHPWMGAAVFVEEHPWFAVTDEQGAFLVSDVPPGEYVVEATHELLGKVSGTVSVKAGVSTGFRLTIGR